MAHTSFYRTYRPATFADMVGQKHIERTLKNAVATDQVAHAYLFSGPRGTGKTTTARILAAALLCEHPQNGEPDGTCEQCQEVANGTHPDVMELDAASRTGVDNVRDEIIARVQFAPVRGRSKIYIIDEVHMLSTGAFNAFLKTLEEPPAHVVFILCTTDPQKVPETIRSRCQQFEFRPYAVEELTDQLQRIGTAEGIKAEPEALALIAARARGGMRDAITAFEQMAAFTDNNITVSAVEETLGGADAASLAALVRIVATADTPACFTWVAEQVNKGADLPEVVHALIDYVRDLYVLQVLGAQPGVIDRSVAEQKRMEELLAQLNGPEQIARMLDLLAELSAALRWANEPRTLLELALVRMTRPESDLSVAALSQRIEALEAGRPPAAADSGVGCDRPLPRTSSPHADNDTLAQPKQAAGCAEPQPVTAEAAVHAPSTVAAQDRMPATVPATETARLWREILAQVKQTARSRYALFAEAELESDAEGGYTLSFPADAQFALRAAKEADNVALLNTAAEQVCGQALNPRFMLRGEPSLPGMPEPEVTINDIPEEDMFVPPIDEPSLIEDEADTDRNDPGVGDGSERCDVCGDPDEPPTPIPQPDVAAAVPPTPTLQQTPPPAAAGGPSKDVSAIFADLGALPIAEASASAPTVAEEASQHADPDFDSLLAGEGLDPLSDADGPGIPD